MPGLRLEAFSFAEKALQEGYERTAEHQGEAFLNVGTVGISVGDFPGGKHTAFLQKPAAKRDFPPLSCRCTNYG